MKLLKIYDRYRYVKRNVWRKSFFLTSICELLIANWNNWFYLFFSFPFDLYKLDCDVNCHKKCEKLTANLCGVNQKMIVEAIASVRKGMLLCRPLFFFRIFQFLIVQNTYIKHYFVNFHFSVKIFIYSFFFFANYWIILVHLRL